MMGESRRDTQLMGECKRQAGDGVETCRRDTRMMGESRRDTRVMGECKRQASDGGEQANDGGVVG